jgi:hypothetical protein
VEDRPTRDDPRNIDGALARVTLAPPEWTGRTPARKEERGSAQPVAISRRTGAKAEEAALRAALEDARADVSVEDERTLSIELARFLASRGKDLDEATSLALHALRMTDGGLTSFDGARSTTSDVELRRELSHWLESLGEAGLAAAVLRPIVESSGEPAMAAAVLVRVGVLHARAGDPSGAGEAFEEAARRDAGDALALELRGTLAAWAPDVVTPSSAAVSYVDAAIRRSASNGDPLEDLLRAFEAEPTSSVATSALASLFGERGKTGAADEFLRAHGESFAASDPKRAALVHASRRTQALAAGDVPRALGAALDEHLDEAFEGEAASAMNDLLLRAGLHDLLVARLEVAAERAPRAQRAQLYEAIARFYAGALAQPARAAASYVEVVAADPGSEEGFAALRAYAASSGDETMLVEALVRVSKARGDDSDAVRLPSARALELLAEERSHADLAAFARVQGERIERGHSSASSAASQAGHPPSIWESALDAEDPTALRRLVRERFHARQAVDREVTTAARATAFALVNAVVAGDALAAASALEQIAEASNLQLGPVLLSVAAQRFSAIGEPARGRHVAERACQADPTHPRAAATLASAVAGKTDRIAASALERAIALVGARGGWCARLADVLEFLGELDYAVAWTQRYVALRPGDRAATDVLINRVVRAKDGRRLGDALAWVLSQPQPAAPLSELVARGLTELVGLDADRAVIVGRRALDVFGPHNPSLRASILAAADTAHDDGLASAVIERWIAARTNADERKGLFVSLADRRARLEDHEGEARAIVRALRAGADPGPLEDRIIALRGHPLSGDGELAQAESRAICIAATGDTAQASQAWRNFGAALWDLAGDRRGAVAAWLRAAELAPKRGYYTLGMDIAKFADSRFAVICLSDLVAKEKDRARAGAIAAEAARAALAIGEPLKAFELACLALERTPQHTDALEIAEHGAVGAGQPKAMSALYDAMGKRALGRYGCRAAHYRGARFFEQHGDPKLALKHAASAFSAVPSEGATLVLLSRTADRADDRAYAVRTIEGVADVARSTGARAAWLLRAAQVAAPGGEGARQRVDILLRASLLAPDLGTLALLADAARQLLRDLPEESDALAFRVANASRMLTAKVEGPDGARVAIALASLSLELFADNDGALAALSRALGADADLEEYAKLIVHAEALTAAEGIADFMDRAVALIERPYSNVGVGALKLLAKIAGARGDSALKGKLTVYAAEREPEDAGLVVAADEAAQRSGDPALVARLDKKVPRDERAEILRLFAREQDDEGALATLERALVLVPPDGREAIERDIRSIYERAGRGDELERRALREAKSADIPAQTRAERFVEVAQIREDRQEHAGAAEALLEAARLDPDPLTHWSALERVSELGGLNEFRIIALKEIEARVAPDARPAVLRRLARAHEDVGDAEAATEALEKLLVMAPGDDEADHEVEALIVARGNYAKLVQHLARRADRLSRPPNDDRDSVRALRLRRAAILEQRLGLVQEACSELEALREEWPDNESVLRYLADLYERAGQMDRAGSIWRHLSVLAQGPETQSNLELRAAFALRDARDFPAAFMMVKELLGHGRREAPVLELWADLARALVDDRELGEALEARALYTDADAHARGELWVEAAQAAARVGETAVSLVRAQRAAEVEPARASTQLFARGLEYRVRGAGSLEDAQHTIDQLSGIDGKLDAEDASLRAFLIAEALTVVGAGETALTKLSEAYAELGAQPLVALGMAERLISANQFSAAVPFFRAALDGNLLGFRSRGVVALAGADAAIRCDQAALALQMLEEATFDEDTRITALKRTAHLAASLGDVVRSRAVLMEIARSGNTEDRAVTLAQLGRMLYTSGDNRDQVEAERAFLEAIDAAPVESVLHAQLVAELATLRGRASLYPPISEPPPADATKPAAQSPAYLKDSSGQLREIADFERSVRDASGKDERIHARRALARAHAERGAKDAAEAVLWEALEEGSVEAGDDLAIILEGTDGRTSDLLRTRQLQADLVPGALWRLEALRAAALADRNTAYARAVEHVTRALDPGAGPLPPPPLVAQSHQPGMLAVLTRPSQGPMFEALALVWEAGQSLFARDPAEYTQPAPGGGPNAREQVLAGGTSRLSRLYEVSTKLLETPRIPLYLQKGTEPPAVHLALLAPPSALVVGDAREESPSLRYALGQALSAALPQNVLLMGLPERDGRSMWRAVLGAFGPPGFGRELDVASGRLAESFWQSFPSKTQRRLQELLRDAAVIQYDVLAEAARQSSRRTGLFLSGDFNLAVRKVLDELDVLDAPALISELGVDGLCARFGAIADLLRLAVSAAYADARWTPLPPASQRGKLLPSGRYKFS